MSEDVRWGSCAEGQRVETEFVEQGVTIVKATWHGRGVGGRVRGRWVAVLLVALGVLLGGCGQAPEPPAASPPPPSSVPKVDPNQAACTLHKASAGGTRRVSEAMRISPLPPGGVYFALGSARSQYAVAVTNPALVAAMAEVVAALDDIEVQGRNGMPPGGNILDNPVQFDPTRLLAALDLVDRACAGL